VKNFCAYLAQHCHRIVNYKYYQAEQLCSIGSGAVESAIKQLGNESKFPEHSGKLKMLIKSCLSVVLTSTVYWLSNVSAKMGCSQRILIIKPKYDLLSGLKDSFWNDYLFSDRDKEAVDFSVDDAGHK